MKKLNEMEIFEVNPITNNQNKDYQLSIFLAGTIDMGSSRDWQQEFIQQLIKASQNVKEQTGTIAVFNPRRPPEYGVSNPNFDLRDQIRWELEHLEKANTIIMYIIGSSKSPVSLIELGLFARSKKLTVICEPDYFRYTNVEETCKFYNVDFYNDYNKFIENFI